MNFSRSANSLNEQNPGRLGLNCVSVMDDHNASAEEQFTCELTALIYFPYNHPAAVG